MGPALIAGLFTVVGATIGALGAYLGSHRVNREQAQVYEELAKFCKAMIDTLKGRVEDEQYANLRLRAALRENTANELSRYLSSVKRELGAWQGGLGLGRAVDLDRVYVDVALRGGDEQFHGDRKAAGIFRHLLEAHHSGHHHTVLFPVPGPGRAPCSAGGGTRWPTPP